jgi:hypothetical protein
VLAGSAPGASSTSEKVALTGPAAEGTDLVAANVGRPRWPNFVSPLVLVLALVAAALIRRRGRDADDHPHQDLTPIAVAPPAPEERPRRFTSPGLGTGTGPSAATPVAGVPAKTPIAGVPAGTPVAGVPAGTPVAGLPTRTPVAVPVLPPGAVPEFKLDQALTGRVDIPLARSGSVSMSPRAPGAAAALRDPKADDDPRSEEYRSLFDEYVKLRRTTGESVEGLDAAHFVETLREKRAQIMKQVPVKDVRFKLAFQNGKAGVRYVTVS